MSRLYACSAAAHVDALVRDPVPAVADHRAARCVIRQPDPTVIWQLAELYELDFTLLAQWLGLTEADNGDAAADVTETLISMVLNLTTDQKLRVLDLLEKPAVTNGRDSTAPPAWNLADAARP